MLAYQTGRRDKQKIEIERGEKLGTVDALLEYDKRWPTVSKILSLSQPAVEVMEPVPIIPTTPPSRSLRPDTGKMSLNISRSWLWQ